MDTPNPFIYNPKIQKKEEFEPEPLYIELGPPPPIKEKEESEEETPRVIIIEIL